MKESELVKMPAWVTEGLILTDGEFLLKAMLFILDNSKTVSLLCVFCLWRSRTIMCNVCGPGKHLSQPGSSNCGPGKCVTLFVEGISHCYQFLWKK